MKVNVPYIGYLSVIDDNGIGVAGLIDSDFYKAVSLDGEIVSWGVVVAEVNPLTDRGLYSFTITPLSVGSCHIHIWVGGTSYQIKFASSETGLPTGEFVNSEYPAFTPNAYAFELWAKFGSYVASESVFVFGFVDTDTGEVVFGLISDLGLMPSEFRVYRIWDGHNNKWVDWTGYPEVESWIHFIFSFDGANYTAYYNGVSTPVEGSDPPLVDEISGIPFVVAGAGVVLDGCKFYGRGVTAEEAVAKYNSGQGIYGILPDTDLLAGYNFDEGAGLETADYSGNANTLTGEGEITWEPGEVANPINEVDYGHWRGTFEVTIDSEGGAGPRVLVNVDSDLIRPVGESKTYRMFLSITDGMGVPLAPDSIPTIKIDSVAGESRVEETEMTYGGSVGQYYYDYAITNESPLETQVVRMKTVIGGATRYINSFTEIYEEAVVLQLTRRAGSVIADGTEQDLVVFDAPTGGYIVMKGLLDLSNMVAGDRIIIREKYRIEDEGGYMLLDKTVVQGAPGEFPVIDLTPSMPNRYGFKYTIQQVAGDYKTFKFELYCQENPV